MATKFNIFCDNSPATLPTKAGPQQQQPQQHQQLHQQQKQHLEQQQQPQAQVKREPLGPRQQQQTQSNTITASSPSKDQENDISFASLGSDFVPSIFEFDESFQEEEEASFENENSCDIAEDELVDYDDEDFDENNDVELQMELSQAFKQHDDSQLFKSTIYINDIENYLHKLERVPDLRPLPNYMDFQRDIDTDKRAILINWLVEVSDEYELQSETLFICTNIIDRFLSQMSISTSNFQLLGVAAMFIASKYEEIYPPYLHQFVEVTDDTYSGQQIRHMEQEILKVLNFRISLPTVTFFLRQIFAFNKFAKKVYHMAEYLCYLSLLDDQPFLEYYPSEIAIAAVILSAHQLDAADNISPELKRAYDRSNQDQLDRRQLPKGAKLRDIDRRAFIVDQDLPFCIESLRAIQERAFSRSSSVQADSAIYIRYTKDSYSRVALLPPPKVEDLLNY